MEHVQGVCKIGQGEACCRYLVMVPDTGFECVKHEELANVIDAKVRQGSYHSKGDNCEGRTGYA